MDTKFRMLWTPPLRQSSTKVKREDILCAPMRLDDTASATIFTTTTGTEVICLFQFCRILRAGADVPCGTPLL
jgi:hypothetical protein